MEFTDETKEQIREVRKSYAKGEHRPLNLLLEEVGLDPIEVADDWKELLSEDEYWEAVEYLKGLDEVWGVEDSGYHTPEIWVYTPYCDGNVVGDVIDDLGFHIEQFAISEYEGDKCILIMLDFDYGVPSKMPKSHRLDNRNGYREIEWVDENSKLFDR